MDWDKYPYADSDLKKGMFYLGGLSEALVKAGHLTPVMRTKKYKELNKDGLMKKELIEYWYNRISMIVENTMPVYSGTLQKVRDYLHESLPAMTSEDIEDANFMFSAGEVMWGEGGDVNE